MIVRDTSGVLDPTERDPPPPPIPCPIDDGFILFGVKYCREDAAPLLFLLAVCVGVGCELDLLLFGSLCTLPGVVVLADNKLPPPPPPPPPGMLLLLL